MAHLHQPPCSPRCQPWSPAARAESVPPSSHDLRAPALRDAPLKMTAVSFAKPCSSIVSRMRPALKSVQLTAARYFRRWSCCSVTFAGSPVAPTRHR